VQTEQVYLDCAVVGVQGCDSCWRSHPYILPVLFKLVFD